MSDDITVSELVERLASGHGPDLRGYKPATLERRIRRRMSQTGVGSLGEYLQRIQRDGKESIELLNTVLINVTEFFRDPPAWETLRKEILPQLLKSIDPGSSFRAWSAGCATGEEAYSLAILIAELLGPSILEYDIKIYATDIDEEALNIARRGEYHIDKLRHMKSILREKYFTGTGTSMRIIRELRRLVIFGRSNIVSDAAISHCHLVMCRNVLIYFDTNTQKQVLSRLHYALEPGGILFLGKAESKLTESHHFRALNLRWRIFQKPGKRAEEGSEREMRVLSPPDGPQGDKESQSKFALYQQHILDTVKSAVILADTNDIVVAHNEAAVSTWGLGSARLVGRRLQNTELAIRCPELLARMETTRGVNNDAVQFACALKNNAGEDRQLSVTLRPMTSEKSEKKDRLGTLIHAEDITAREKLSSTVQRLETTSEELQSANEELETTNEELQSTNEELETTNEELQSTNEELETTNEELQSLNEELENMNEELEHRTQELNALNSRYAETLQSMPWPVVMVDGEENIQLWNAAARQLFGVGSTSVVGLGIDRLPIGSEARKALVRRFRAVLANPKPSVMRFTGLRVDHELAAFNIHFTPVLSPDNKVDGVLIMFGQEGNSNRSPERNKSKDKIANRKAAASKSKRK
jgi:two-component system CheB/CheR fusion protein